jgi:peptide/nickel transport system substrate-binding protein
VMEHAVILPMTYDRTLHYRHPTASNVYVHPAFGLYDLQAVGVADAAAPTPGERARKEMAG